VLIDIYATRLLAQALSLSFSRYESLITQFFALVDSCRMEDASNNKLRETRDRLVPLLIIRLREGWELEFEKLTRREIARLGVPAGES
jgi:hypothetical protein